MKTKRILYLSHVSWNWIKQRPQFLAEELSKYYKVTYVQSKVYNKELISNETTVPIKKLFRLPFVRFNVIRLLNSLFYKLQLFFQALKSDIIWMSSPEMLDYVFPMFLKRKVVIYDCMDDMLELCPPHRIEEFKKLEYRLYDVADVILCSSQYLSQKLKQRYGEKKITIVNNAIKNDLGGLNAECCKINVKKENIFTITYIGSIDYWMDFDLIRAIHNRFPKIEFKFWGPNHVDIPQNIGIEYCGVAEHSRISKIMEESNLLIMPFIVNELIKSVNPVKLYEYIYSGKPCLAPNYGETEQFSQFVFLYNTAEDCFDFIEKVMYNRYTHKKKEECEAFALLNTWHARGISIKNQIESIC